MTSQIIKRYQIEGQVIGKRLLQARETHAHTLVTMMRDDGFVPVLDIDPVFTIEWVTEDRYNFCYTWQAVYVGKEKAWQIEGNLGGKMILSIPKTK